MLRGDNGRSSMLLPMVRRPAAAAAPSCRLDRRYHVACARRSSRACGATNGGAACDDVAIGDATWREEAALVFDDNGQVVAGGDDGNGVRRGSSMNQHGGRP